MKKYLVVLVALLLVVTGCGAKKLTCTMTEDGQTMEAVMEFDKNDEVTSIEMNMTMPFEEELSKEEQETYSSYMQVLCSMYDYEGVDCNVNTSSKAVDVVIKMDLEKMSDEDRNNVTGTEGTTYDEIKADLEESGYTCK